MHREVKLDLWSFLQSLDVNIYPLTLILEKTCKRFSQMISNATRTSRHFKSQSVWTAGFASWWWPILTDLEPSRAGLPTEAKHKTVLGLVKMSSSHITSYNTQRVGGEEGKWRAFPWKMKSIQENNYERSRGRNSRSVLKRKGSELNERETVL